MTKEEALGYCDQLWDLSLVGRATVREAIEGVKKISFKLRKSIPEPSGPISVITRDLFPQSWIGTASKRPIGFLLGP